MTAASGANPAPCGHCASRFSVKADGCKSCPRFKMARCAKSNCPLAGTQDPRCARCPGPPTVKRSCHSCEWNGKGLPICWGCPGPNAEFITDGQSLVTLGSVDDPENLIEANLDKSALPERDAGEAMADRLDGFADAPTDGVTALAPETESALLRVLQLIAGMHKSELLVFHGLLNGLTMTAASASCGFSKQNGSKRLKALVARFPELGAFVRSCHKVGWT